MTPTTLPISQSGPQDRVSKVLIGILVIATLVCGSAMVFATRITYQKVAPLPQVMSATDGGVVLTRAQVVARLGTPLYANENGYLQLAKKNVFDVYLDWAGHVQLVGLIGPGFCTSGGVCVGDRMRDVLERAAVQGVTFHRGAVTALLPPAEQVDVGRYARARSRSRRAFGSRSGFDLEGRAAARAETPKRANRLRSPRASTRSPSHVPASASRRKGQGARIQTRGGAGARGLSER